MTSTRVRSVVDDCIATLTTNESDSMVGDWKIILFLYEIEVKMSSGSRKTVSITNSLSDSTRWTQQETEERLVCCGTIFIYRFIDFFITID